METPSSSTKETQWDPWNISHAAEPSFTQELLFDSTAICDQGMLPAYFNFDAYDAALAAPGPDQILDLVSGTSTPFPISSSDIEWNLDPDSTAPASAADSQSLSMADLIGHDNFEATPPTTGSPLAGVQSSQYPPTPWWQGTLSTCEVEDDSLRDGPEEPPSRDQDLYAEEGERRTPSSVDSGHPGENAYLTVKNQPQMANDLSAKPADIFSCRHKSCSQTFTEQHKLRRHNRVHTKPHCCKVCGTGHAEKRDYHRHMWANHRDVAEREGMPSESVKCSFPDCGFSGRKDNVRRHEKRHSPRGRKGRPLLPRPIAAPIHQAPADPGAGTDLGSLGTRRDSFLNYG